MGTLFGPRGAAAQGRGDRAACAATSRKSRCRASATSACRSAASRIARCAERALIQVQQRSIRTARVVQASPPAVFHMLRIERADPTLAGQLASAKADAARQRLLRLREAGDVPALTERAAPAQLARYATAGGRPARPAARRPRRRAAPASRRRARRPRRCVTAARPRRPRPPSLDDHARCCR